MSIVKFVCKSAESVDVILLFSSLIDFILCKVWSDPGRDAIRREIKALRGLTFVESKTWVYKLDLIWVLARKHDAIQAEIAMSYRYFA